jgi:hypothetical protein
MTLPRHVRAAVVFAFTALLARSAPVSLRANEWTLEADGDRGTLQLSQTTLGPVLRNIQLRVGSSGETLSGWTAESSGNELLIHLKQPRITWSFRLEPNQVSYATTDPQCYFVAEAPAGPERHVVRTMDRDGYPVIFQGTSEVKRDFGGQKTQRPSFLPRENPDVMYFSLGTVSGQHFHALFDRKSDTAIDFGAGAHLLRNERDPKILQVTTTPGNAVFRITPDYFTHVLGLPFYRPIDDSYFQSAPMVWSSWTSYYEGVTEDDIVKNTDWLAKNLKPYGFQFVQLDDGYDRGPQGEHTWIENWNKTRFPHGPKWLADYIRSKGLRPGIWLVANSYAGALKSHPEWYLRDKDGNYIKDYSTPALDSSNPQVVSTVRHIFQTLDDWGFDYYKIDGEFALPAYDPNVDKSKLYDAYDPVGVYRHRLAAIRDVIGPERFIEGCPSGTPLNGIGFFNSVFNGEDLFANWQGMYSLFSSVNGSAFLNHMAVYLMPGEGIELAEPMTVEEGKKKRRPIVIESLHGREDPLTGFGTTDAEAHSVLTYLALTGVTYPLASVMSEVPQSRVAMLKATMPTLPILPMDLFSRGTDMEWNTFQKVRAADYLHTYPHMLDLKVNAVLGTYDVLGVTNWTEAEETTKISLPDKLGVSPGKQYIAFDFWNGKLLGPLNDTLPARVQPHDTAVYLIHSALGHPQVVGTSRHITGAYALKNVDWNDAGRTLRGTSDSVPEDPYRLWIYLPGSEAPRLITLQANGKNVPYQQALDGHLLTITFKGVSAPVSWNLQF